MRQSAQQKTGTKRAAKKLRRAQKARRQHAKKERLISRKLAGPEVPGTALRRVGNRVVRFFPEVIHRSLAARHARSALQTQFGHRAQVPTAAVGAVQVGDVVEVDGDQIEIMALVPFDGDRVAIVGRPPVIKTAYAGKLTFTKAGAGYNVGTEDAAGPLLGYVVKDGSRWAAHRLTSGVSGVIGSDYGTRQLAADALR